MEQKSFAKGTVIFRAGDAGSTMYMIRAGKVGVFADYGADAEKKLTELEAGRCFGEMGVVENKPRSATAVALEETTVEEIGGEELGGFFKENPEILMGLLRQLSGRLRAMTDNYIDACGTIREMENGGKKSAGLMAKIKKFIADYDRSQMASAQSVLREYEYFN